MAPRAQDIPRRVRERVRFRWHLIQAQRNIQPQISEPVPWSQKQAILDAELKSAIEGQQAELTAYRTESLQLVGFGGVVAGLSAALRTSSVEWAVYATMAIFALLLLADLALVGPWTKAITAGPSAVWDAARKSERLGVSPTIQNLHSLVLAGRRTAYTQNEIRIRRRRRLLVSMRVGLLAAVLLSGAAAIYGGSSAGHASPKTPPPTNPTNGSQRRHHH